MKRYAVALAAIGLVALSAPAARAQKLYVGAQAGLVVVPDGDTQVQGFVPSTMSYDPGFGLGVMLGAKIDAVRLEGEVTYRSNDTDTLSDFSGSIPVSGDVSSTSLMVNGYWDIRSASNIAPYVGMGLGFANIAADARSLVGDIDDSDVVAAFQLVAGVGISLSPKTTLDISYRFFVTQDPSFTNVFGERVDTEYSAHNLMLGVRFGL